MADSTEKFIKINIQLGLDQKKPIYCRGHYQYCISARFKMENIPRFLVLHAYVDGYGNWFTVDKTNIINITF